MINNTSFNFSIIGKWENEPSPESGSNSNSSIQFVFVNECDLKITIQPGKEFYCTYTLEHKSDYSILKYSLNERKGAVHLVLFKCINENKLKVQFLDLGDAPEWQTNEKALNTGYLNRTNN